MFALDTDILGSVATAATGFIADFAPAVVTVLGIGLGVGLSIWGVPKLIGIFRKTAK